MGEGRGGGVRKKMSWPLPFMHLCAIPISHLAGCPVYTKAFMEGNSGEWGGLLAKLCTLFAQIFL